MTTLALEFFLKSDQTGKIGFQRKTDKTDKIIAEHMQMLEAKLNREELVDGGVYKIYMRVTSVKEREATVLDSLETAEGEVVTFSDEEEDAPF
jgi:hypothetical protein